MPNNNLVTEDYQISEVTENEYRDFALYTVESRAIPSMIDGLKPVQRFYLFSSLKNSKKDFKKVFDAFKKDIYENFNMDHDNLRDAETVDKNSIDKVVGKLCTDVWRPVFLSEAERE